MTDGTDFETMSTWGKEGDTLKLDIDPKSHAAWTGGSQKILDKGQVSKYNKKFTNLRFYIFFMIFFSTNFRSNLLIQSR